jgi:hypothetical protein
MATFTIDLRAIKACAIAASNEETRYYLNGVRVEHTPAGPVFVATDNARLIAARHNWRGDTGAPKAFAPFIVPLSLIKRIKVGARGSNDATVTLATVVNNVLQISIAHNGVTYTEGGINATYPNWRAVVPRDDASGELAHYDFKLLATFAEATKALHGRGDFRPFVAHNGPNNPAMVDLLAGSGAPIEAFGVIMPIRDRRNAPLTRAPAWTAPAAE